VAFRTCFAAGLVFYITVDKEASKTKNMPQCSVGQVGMSFALDISPVTTNWKIQGNTTFSAILHSFYNCETALASLIFKEIFKVETVPDISDLLSAECSTDPNCNLEVNQVAGDHKIENNMKSRPSSSIMQCH